MAGPGDNAEAGKGRGDGRLRASHADREQVIDTLKDAFVQGRLDKGELDARVGRAFASRTYAELAVLTADIPADPAPRQPAWAPNRASRGHPIRNGAIVSGTGLVVAIAAVLGAFKLDDHASRALLQLAGFIVLVMVPVVMMVAIGTAWEQRRPRRQLPSRPGPGGHAREAGQSSGTGPGPALPRDRPDRARADLRSDRSQPGRSHSSGRGVRAPRGVRPVPGAA
jgi:Domain of unknown function (DUF1707)